MVVQCVTVLKRFRVVVAFLAEFLFGLIGESVVAALLHGEVCFPSIEVGELKICGEGCFGYFADLSEQVTLPDEVIGTGSLGVW